MTAPLAGIDAAAVWLLAMSVQISWVVLGLILLDRLVRRVLWAQQRLFLWMLVLVKLCLPLELGSPAAWIELAPDSAAPVVRGWSPSRTAATGPPIEPFSPPTSFLPGAPAPPAHGSQALRLGFLLWAAGICVCGVWLVRRYRAEWRRLECAASPLPAGPAAGSLADLARRAGLRRVPTVRTSPAATGPLIVGLRARVYLPALMVAKAGTIEWDHALLHEFVHVRRRDAWLGLVLAFVQVVFWFHPLVRYWAGRVRALQEEACDRTVADLLDGDVRAYRRTLLRFAVAGGNEGGPQLVSATPFLRGAAVRSRLDALQRFTPRHRWLRRSAAALLVAIYAVCALPMGTRSLAAEVEPFLSSRTCPDASSVESPPDSRARSPRETPFASLAHAATPNAPGCLALRMRVLALLAASDRDEHEAADSHRRSAVGARTPDSNSFRTHETQVNTGH